MPFVRPKYENQDSINIRITESATFEDNPDFVNILQEKVIQLPPISPAGYEIQVTFNVDNNGVFHASILNVKSGERSDITIAGIESNLTDQFTVNDEVQEVGSKYGSKSIGIDLGNLYSAISSINEHGIPTIIRNSEGQNRTPSCIESNGDEVTVGEIAIKGLGWNDYILSRFIS